MGFVLPDADIRALSLAWLRLTCRAQLRRLFYARVILSAGGGQKELMELTGLKSYPASLTMTAARRVTDSFCQKAVELVLQTDVAMKTGADDPERLLELLLVQLSQEARHG